jgi:hypothetical protein
MLRHNHPVRQVDHRLTLDSMTDLEIYIGPTLNEELSELLIFLGQCCVQGTTVLSAVRVHVYPSFE